jgi:hypothetical protein
MRLYVHPGLSKTGSTAIQKYLYENSDSLKRIGYYYPLSGKEQCYISDSFRSSGNGSNFYVNLNRNSLDPKKKYEIAIDFMSAWIDGAITHGCSNIIISSESLCLLSQDDLEVIIRARRELDIELNFIYFIRNPYDWLFSSWLQATKRSAQIKWLSESFNDSKDSELLPLSFPQKIQGLMHPRHYVEHKYEEVRRNLIFTFLNSLDMPEAVLQSLPKPQETIVNRSLTRYEFALFFFANKASGGNQQLSQLLSSLIADDNANQGEFYFVDNYSIDRVIKWCSSFSPCVLDAYKESLGRMTEQAKPMSEDDFTNSLSTDQRNVIRFIEIITMFYGNIISEANKLALHKRKIYSDSEYLKKVPADFNVFIYLVLNQDVLFSNVDPYRHYYERGQIENRSYDI